MANRVTPAEVKEVYDTTSDVDTFITTANLLVDEELVGQGLSENRLKQIELYLAAHLAYSSLERGGLKKKKVGDTEEEYRTMGATALGLLSTGFGQQAVALDNTGILGTLSKSTVKARFRVL